MKYLSVLMLPLLASCPGQPQPPPDTEPGHDCAKNGSAYSGFVPVANAIAGRYIVIMKKPKPGGIQPLVTISAQAHAESVGAQDIETLGAGYAARIAANVVRNLVADPTVQYVQPDSIKSVPPNETRSVEPTESWGQDRSDQRDLPLDGQYDTGNGGEGVNVAIVDTGITPHPDFQDRLAIGGFSAHGSTLDGNGHGTHVAGTVAGTTWGVAKQATLHAVRVLDSNGSGSDSDVIRGIEWVTAKKLTNPTEQWVINMSLGGSPSPALDQATCNAINAGVTVVAAAGNETEDARNSSPARVRQAITVGATEIFLGKDRQATFSNYGELLDLYAPGVNITSTSNRGGTETFSGTSMASPHVAGAAALLLKRLPGSKPAEVADALVSESTKGVVTNLGPGSPDRLLYVREE